MKIAFCCPWSPDKVHPEITGGGKPGPSGVRDEAVVGLDDFGEGQGSDDTGELMNDDVELTQALYKGCWIVLRRIRERSGASMRCCGVEQQPQQN